MSHFFGFGHGKGEGGLEWDEILIALFSLLTWFRGGQTAATEGGKDEKQKIVSVLQSFFSRVDEGIWLSLIAQLDTKEKLAITRLLYTLNRFREKDAFRLTVINAPKETSVPDPSDAMGQKRIKSDQDGRVIFLRDIAALVNNPTWGRRRVRHMLRAHELATENVVARRALAFWKGTLAWMNRTVCGFFGVQNLNEITPSMVMRTLNRGAAQAARHVDWIATEYVPDRNTADMNLGFWRHTYRNHRVQAGFLLLGIIAAILFFAAN